MKGQQPHLAHAGSELNLLQRILGLRQNEPEKLAPNLEDAVFICIDCEAFEHAQHKITEIGVAVLDTRDVFGTSPGKQAENWNAKTKHAHFRPVEYAKLRNKKFIKGCPEGFNFGETEWINLGDAAKVMRRVFADPVGLGVAGNFDVHVKDQRRNVVFVAHGGSNDETYLNRLGFSLKDNTTIAWRFDTITVAGSTKKNSVSLQRLLLSLGIEPVNLHNAGNDAAYTLQALLLMACKDYERAGSVFSDWTAMNGELPEGSYNDEKARHIYSGTAVPPEDEDTEKAKESKGVELSESRLLKRLKRRRRRQQARARRVASRADGGHGTAGTD